MSITMLLEMAASAYGDRAALGTRADGISYESLSRTVVGGAGMITASGARSVAIVGLNGPALPALLMASAAAGVPFSPLNYRASAEGLASAGRPVPGIEAEIRGPDGRPAADGDAGELWVRGPQVSGFYQGIGSVLDDAGWFPTRDQARIDTDGYLFIEGRADDTIIRGGENIAPAEIEDVLARHPAVRDVAVVGVPHDEWGEKIVAALVPQPDATIDPDEIRAFVRARLRGSRTPDEVVVRRELPYTPTGKLLRREIVNDLSSPQVSGRT
jgi:acyl-CoA synthetase (AMP-forming)/AMP-acid ligase II